MVGAPLASVEGSHAEPLMEPAHRTVTSDEVGDVVFHTHTGVI